MSGQQIANDKEADINAFLKGVRCFDLKAKPNVKGEAKN